ncbi:cell wall hydrolase [Aestuariivirga sp.]|jgi:spore germination cell wall hydrolase CwlJ-like protein|uniref:cell wall hydrolase n=1 Tax=Aestuariivirga sp. TaxID=2650926 RepID=UPI003784E6F1
MAFGGLFLVMAFAFAGHYLGQNAVAHNADPGDVLESVASPSSNILAKGSLMPQAASLDIVNRSSTQVVALGGKGDFVVKAPKVAEAAEKAVQIVPAAINLEEESEESEERTALAPSPRQVEKAMKLKRSAAKDKDTKKEIHQRRVQLAEENCLARAIYFEARSESELGQVAVAKVILNRVKDPEYPKTICGVVYQGSGRRNSCQFSFACDGLPDDVKSAASWSQAKRLAKKVIAGDAKVAALTTATNYHADYVKPKWAKSMKRLVKIGRHIFYEDS